MQGGGEGITFPLDKQISQSLIRNVCRKDAVRRSVFLKKVQGEEFWSLRTGFTFSFLVTVVLQVAKLI